MSMYNQKDSTISSSKDDEYSSGESRFTETDNLKMIRRLANELYKEDMNPESLGSFISDKIEVSEKQATKLIHNKSQSDILNVPQWEQQFIHKAAMNNQMSVTKAEEAMNADHHRSNGYYFLPNYQAIPSSKNMESTYWNNNLDVYSIRKDFPILQRRINGKPLVWLDNGATTQKPTCMMNALNRYYSEYNSNIHRGAHTLSKLATNAYEEAREKVRSFIGAASTEEIVFVRGTTEAINLVAESFGEMSIHPGDEIVLTMMEHHSNIVPWQKLSQTKGAVIKVIPINDRGEVILDEYEKLLTSRTRMVAITHVSNVLGTVNPVRTMVEMAHRHGACVLIDGAQAVPHLSVDMNELDADFYVFSGHKVYGPTGIGVLYGRKTLLEKMPPWQSGGGMIKNVSFDETTYNSLPYKFEAGTGNIADAIGLGVAIDYIQKIGMDSIEKYEKEITGYAMEKLYKIPGVYLIGTSPNKTSVISFVIDGVSPEKAAQYLNQDGIAVRSGHHCAQPALRRYGLTSSIRASLGVYNTMEEVDYLVNSVLKIAKF